MPSTVPELVRFVPQNGDDNDCSVATLATLCGVTYSQALAAFVEPVKVLRRGAYWKDMQTAARRLGVKTRVVRNGRFDIQCDTGILCVRKPKEEHVVFLWAGRIVEGNRDLYLCPYNYCAVNGYTPKSLLVRVE